MARVALRARSARAYLAEATIFMDFVICKILVTDFNRMSTAHTSRNRKDGQSASRTTPAAKRTVPGAQGDVSVQRLLTVGSFSARHGGMSAAYANASCQYVHPRTFFEGCHGACPHRDRHAAQTNNTKERTSDTKRIHGQRIDSTALGNRARCLASTRLCCHCTQAAARQCALWNRCAERLHDRGPGP